MATLSWPETPLGKILATLERRYGAPPAPKFANPFEMVLWEIVAYLADDDVRLRAFEALAREVGLTPPKILAAPRKTLVRITHLGGSIAFDERADRLKIAAQLALDEFAGDLRRVLKVPLPKAKRSLMKFPMIGEPGAEKILLFSGAQPILALESNGLRVLVRLGYGTENKSYAASYRSVREATLDQLPENCAVLTAAHLLLRRHGQQTCLRTEPACGACPVREHCPYGRSR